MALLQIQVDAGGKWGPKAREVNPISAKRNPSENRGQNLKFPRFFVRYQSTYEHSASIHINKGVSSRLSQRIAVARFSVTVFSIPSIWSQCLGSAGPQTYDNATYSSACSSSRSITSSWQLISLSNAPASIYSTLVERLPGRVK
jgi:hypothetical protein